MTARSLRRVMIAVYLIGALARLGAWRVAGGAHPDEFFQSLEPAWTRLNGVGMTTWEWRDGVRSWVLPGYNGAWLALFRALGVARGSTLGSLVQLHWALVSLALIGAAYRGGASVARTFARRSPDWLGADAAPPGWEGGVAAALLCALFPPIVAFSSHTLSELPSTLCLVAALALAAERSEPGATGAVPRGVLMAIGALLALGVGIRIANAPVAIVPPLLFVIRRRFGALGWMTLGAALPVAIFGGVDWLTWGRPFGSFVGYLQYNLVQGKAVQFGTSPWWWYVSELGHRAPCALLLATAAIACGIRASWPFAASAALLVATLSTQAHKEDRFIFAVWPLLLIGAAGVAGGAIARRRGSSARARTRGVLAAFGVATALLLADAAARLGGEDNTFARAWLDGQSIAGRDAGMTGMLIDSAFYSGGALWFGSSAPQLEFKPDLLANPLISHALVRTGSDNERLARRAGFVSVVERDSVVLLKRR